MEAFPPIHPPGEMGELWTRGLQELKKIPVNPRHRLLLKKSLGKEAIYEVSFTGYGDANIQGILSLPRRKKGIPAIIEIHDYNAPIHKSSKGFTEMGMAHLILELREHRSLEWMDRKQEKKAPSPAKKTDGGQSEPGLFVVHPFEKYRQDDAITSYPFALFLDAIRAVDFLRLQKEVDHTRIGILGSGLGAAMGAMAAVHRKNNITALAMERPSFIHLQNWLDGSDSPLAQDLRKVIQIQKPSVRQRIHRSLDLVDPFHWSESLESPLFMSIEMDDTSSPPLPAFSFFHHCIVEKEMHVYMDATQDPRHKDKREKALSFFDRIFNGPFRKKTFREQP